MKRKKKKQKSRFVKMIVQGWNHTSDKVEISQ